MIHLRDYQPPLVEELRAKIKAGNRSVLTQACTAFGKTACCIYMISRSISLGKKSAFLVPRKDLVDQISRALVESDIRHSFIAAGREFYAPHQVHVCTIGSLIRRMNWINPDVLYVDETHFGSNQLDKIIKYYKAQGTVIIGLSATPWKLSGRGLGCWYDAMVQGPSVSWMIEKGWLSEYRYFCPDSPDLSSIHTSAGDYAKGELSETMESNKVLMGSAVEHYKTWAIGKLNVAFCVSRKHAELVAAEFNNNGVPAASVDGTMRMSERSRIFRAFAKREILCLTSIDLLHTGFDLSLAAGMPVTVESMSDLRPTQSLALQVQKWGRVLRKKDEAAFIFDHAGNRDRHQYPDTEREWTLEDRITKKRKKNAEEAVVVNLNFRICPKCFASNPLTAVSCKECKAELPRQEREIEQVEGTLAEVDKAARKVISPARIEQAKAQTMEELIAVGVKLGHKNPTGWAYHIMKARKNKYAKK